MTFDYIPLSILPSTHPPSSLFGRSAIHSSLHSALAIFKLIVSLLFVVLGIYALVRFYRSRWILDIRTRSSPNNTIYCVCVCVFFRSILDIKFVVRTSRGHTGGRSHRIFNPPSFCGACLDFLSREGFSHSFPSSTVKSNFVY